MRYIQLRLTEEQHALLTERANRARRTVPGHIMALLEESLDALAPMPKLAKRPVAPPRRRIAIKWPRRPDASVWRGQPLHELG